jgi:hypothetical protein
MGQFGTVRGYTDKDHIRNEDIRKKTENKDFAERWVTAERIFRKHWPMQSSYEEKQQSKWNASKGYCRRSSG